MADPGLCEAAELSQGEKKGPSDAADVTFFFFFSAQESLGIMENSAPSGCEIVPTACAGPSKYRS